MAARSVPVYLLCGYYGENNLGDDALLTVLLKEIPQPCRLLVTAHDAHAVAELAPDAEVVNRRSLRSVLRSIGRVDAVVFGGGSLLKDSTSLRSLIYYLVIIAIARLQGCPVLLWGQRLGRFSVVSVVQWCACCFPPAAVPAGGIRHPWI